MRERAVLNESVCLGAGDSVSVWNGRGRICGVWLLDVVGRNRVEMAFDISPDEKAGSRRGTAASQCLCVLACQDLWKLIENWLRGLQHMVATVSFVDSRRPDVALCLILRSTYAAQCRATSVLVWSPKRQNMDSRCPCWMVRNLQRPKRGAFSSLQPLFWLVPDPTTDGDVKRLALGTKNVYAKHQCSSRRWCGPFLELFGQFHWLP